jgi:cation diffusion facilitator family transporter
MHTETIEQWMHDHTFGQDRKKSGERRTLIVIVITAVTMIVEIVAGIAFGSMALLADGLHMGSHTSALAISAFAYYYTRRHARDTRFNFGTGKVNSLAAFASAVILALFAVVMVWESVERFVTPVAIEFNQAILVAVIGFVVNGACLFILGGHGHGEVEASRSHGQTGRTHHDHRDHNLWSAYLHVMADALTSLLAIFALLAGKYLGQGWLDPMMGVVGAVLIVRWSWGLLRASSRVLLDMRAPEGVLREIRACIESEGDSRISDLHVWAVGPAIYAAEIALVASRPLSTEEYYRLLPKELGIAHVVVETRRCPAGEPEAAPL